MAGRAVDAAQSFPTNYWYQEPGAVDRWFYGVFEGGGAKGVAYSGALLAMKEKKCWFRGVAGASAGAITAALIASGLSPEELETATGDGLKQVQTGLWSGLWRLRGATGYFTSDRLLDWIEGLLKRQVAPNVPSEPNPKITFQQLYDATGIELNVVAADLSLKRQIIFSHFETPDCSVAEAVVASSSIPFAFPSRLLRVPEEENSSDLYHHTIVDGGVWSNFPLFIFEDGTFRRFYERKPEDIDPRQVLGFILKEVDERPPPRGNHIDFEVGSPRDIRVRECFADNGRAIKSSSLPVKILVLALYPFGLIGRIARLNTLAPRGRWPEPRSRPVRYLVQSLDGMLDGISPPLLALLACGSIVYLGQDLVIGLGRDLVLTVKASILDVMSLLVTIVFTLLLIGIVILATFAGVLAVLVNFILLAAARSILYGLVTTYVAGPGAPVWVAKKSKMSLPFRSQPLPLP